VSRKKDHRISQHSTPLAHPGFDKGNQKRMDKIQVRQIADPERHQVQEEIIAQVEGNPDEFINRYKELPSTRDYRKEVA
jgi:hypothetical protein